MRVFWNSCIKNFENYPEKTYVGESALDKFVRLQSTPYRTKNFTTDTFLEVIRKERVSWNFEKFKKTFVQNYPFFFNVTSLQSRISDSNKIRLQEKYFLWLFSEILEICQENVYNEVILLKLQDYVVESTPVWKKLFHTISRGCSEKLLFESFKKILEKRL